MNKLSLIWKTKDLRWKIFMVLILLLMTRVLAHIPIPGVSAEGLRSFFEGNQFLNLLNIFSGGGLSNFSIALLGVGPYITASIIMQLLVMIIPSLKELQKESGEAGRAKVNQYTRFLTIPLAALSGFGTIRLLQSQGGAELLGVFSPFQWFLTLLAVIAGTMLVMWIGEIISEYGIGNGISMVIFAGIVAQLPATIGSFISLYDPSQLPMIIGFVIAGLLVIAGVVLVTEAQRNVPVSYAKRMQGDRQVGGVSSHLPLRLNQAGVIPIIFAISLLLFPAIIAQFFVNAKTPLLAEWAQKAIDFTNNQGIWYGVAYFVLVVLFTYFYTNIVVNPDEVAENMQRSGGFVPGIRPGRMTADFLYKVLNRITLPGSMFLGTIAVLPFIVQYWTGTQALTFGGTGLLIVVAVVIESIKQVEAQLTMHDYQK
ncbi:MAG TPA: preprotein translocase subunit SecY [Candidatus Doudnabacteria bacterium]|nr:preprotein translocase subunit SecY [Candidatus Doudnabacteria bacterium]